MKTPMQNPSMPRLGSPEAECDLVDWHDCVLAAGRRHALKQRTAPGHTTRSQQHPAPDLPALSYGSEFLLLEPIWAHPFRGPQYSMLRLWARMMTLAWVSPWEDWQMMMMPLLSLPFRRRPPLMSSSWLWLPPSWTCRHSRQCHQCGAF